MSTTPLLSNNLTYQYFTIENLALPEHFLKKKSPIFIKKLKASIEQFGFLNPALINDDGEVICGVARVMAAKELGYTNIPVLVASHLTPDERRAYRIADNKLGELSEWDYEVLKDEFELLSKVGFDLSLTAFDTPEIDLILEGGPIFEEEEVPLPEPPDNPVSQVGDLWILGDHRLVCGDALSQSSYQTVLKGDYATMVFTDPPYNVPIAGFVGGKGKIKHSDFIQGTGEMSPEDFTDFLKGFAKLTVDHSMEGSIHNICMDWRHITEMMNMGTEVYTEFKNLCVWVKNNGGMGSFYRSRHELVFIFKSGKAPHINNFGLGEHGRYRTNVWEYAGVNTMREGRMEELAMHPTVKPLEMVKDAIMDCSHRGDIILDPFGGSGTTLIAAEATGRKACLIELDPKYIDVILERFKNVTNIDPTLSTGETFSEVKNARLSCQSTVVTE